MQTVPADGRHLTVNPFPFLSFCRSKFPASVIARCNASYFAQDTVELTTPRAAEEFPTLEPRLHDGQLYVLAEPPLKGDVDVERKLAPEAEPPLVPHVAHAKESTRPLYPLAKVCVVLARPALPLHVGQAAEDRRVWEPYPPIADEPIEESAIVMPPLHSLSLVSKK